MKIQHKTHKAKAIKMFTETEKDFLWDMINKFVAETKRVKEIWNKVDSMRDEYEQQLAIAAGILKKIED